MMIDRTSPRPSQLKHVTEAVVLLEVKKPAHSLKQDIIETVTGLSSNAITAGGKITAETVVYSGASTQSQETANAVFSSLSMVANVIDFVMVPIGYLYKLYTKQPVPFNLSNNAKWALAALTLILAIVSTVLLVTARIISFISVGISVATAIFALAKYIYDRKKINEKIQDLDKKIDQHCNDIINDMHQINHLQDAVRLIVQQPNIDMSVIQPLVIELAEAYHRYHENCEALKNTYYDKVMCERTLVRLKSPVEWSSSLLKVILAGAVLAGTILSLNPATLPIGMPIIATAAIISLVALIVKKIIEIVQKRQDQKRGLIQDTLITIQINSTALIKKNITNEPLASSKVSTPTVSRKDSYRSDDVTPDEAVPLLANREAHSSDEVSDLSCHDAEPMHDMHPVQRP